MTTSSPEGRQEAAVLDAKALHAAAQIIDPSGIFGLTWQECMERAEAAIRAYLALTPAKPAVEVVEALAKALRESDAWVMAALECKDWHWDDDQRECAELSVKQAHAALAALQAPATPDAQTEVEK